MMEKLETRRINPVSHLATALVAVVVLFELLVISGVADLQAETVKRVAPWAYGSFRGVESFLKQTADMEPAPVTAQENETLTDVSEIIPAELAKEIEAENPEPVRPVKEVSPAPEPSEPAPAASEEPVG